MVLSQSVLLSIAFPRSNLLLNRFLIKDWGTYSKGGRSLSLREMKIWLSKINYKLSNRDAKEFFGLVDRLDEKVIDERGFCQLYHALCNVLSSGFSFVSSDPAHQTVSPTDLLKFHRTYQKDNSITLSDCEKIVERYAPDNKFSITSVSLRKLHLPVCPSGAAYHFFSLSLFVALTLHGMFLPRIAVCRVPPR